MRFAISLLISILFVVPATRIDAKPIHHFVFFGNSYALIREFAGTVTVGIAVQDGNYDHINPKTGKRVTIAELIDFATSYLKADYIFWCTEEPYYSNDVVTFLGKAKK